MANATYDAKWQEAMSELNEQIHVEDHTLGERSSAAMGGGHATSVQEAVQHWSCLYIKYLEIARNLEACYDGVVHPQKRIDIKLILELVLSRVLELKALLVKWSPPHPSLVTAGADGPLPWEYVNFDEVLVDLKLPPKALEVTVPRFFLEEQADAQEARDKLVNALAAVKLQPDEEGKPVSLLLEDGEEAKAAEKPLLELSISEAVEVLQRSERGRQAMMKAQLAAQAAAEQNGKKSGIAQATQIYGTDPAVAATNIQRIYRGTSARAVSSTERDLELEFIGMKRSNQWDKEEGKRSEDKLFSELALARRHRKQEQKDNEENYSNALIELHAQVLEEEGPDMREKMMDERRAWFTEELGKGIFPEDLGGFYLAKNPPPMVEEDAGAAGKKGKDDKKKDDKKKKTEDEPPPETLPPLTGPTLFSRTLKQCIDRYKRVWQGRDEADNFHQRHDVELAKNVVRPNVEEEVREHVDKMLVLQLQNLKTQLEAAASGGKKGKKGKKDKKGKKGKKGKKEKKGKALPGEKLCAGMDLEEMLAELIGYNVVAQVSPEHRLDDLLGDFNYIGSAYKQHSELRNKEGFWEPQDPSISQVRASLAELIALPLGCPLLRATAPYSKSVLLYGPEGSGKTKAMQAVAAQTRALVLNISPSVLENLPKEFKEGKSGPTKFVHMVFAVARNPNFAPAIVYIDEVEKVFVGKKKGGGAGDAAKFKKDLVTYVNSLKPEERVVIIGNSAKPYEIPDGELKDIRQVFQRSIYMPYPDYASRSIIWRHFLERAFDKVEQDIPSNIDISALALLSAGYSPGSISLAINKSLTTRRLAHLKSSPVSEKDFITSLSALPCTYKEDNSKFQAFTANITGLQERREKVKSILSGEGDGKKDAKKDKKK